MREEPSHRQLLLKPRRRRERRQARLQPVFQHPRCPHCRQRLPPGEECQVCRNERLLLDLRGVAELLLTSARCLSLPNRHAHDVGQAFELAESFLRGEPVFECDRD